MLKKIINKKVYDTEHATLIAEYTNGLPINDFKFVYEDLYVTEASQFFLHVQGGPLTKYSESNGNSAWGIESIIPLNNEQVCGWLEKHNKINEIENYFPQYLQEG